MIDRLLWIRINEDLRETTVKEKTTNLKNDILNDLLIGMVNKPFPICLFGFCLETVYSNLSAKQIRFHQHGYITRLTLLLTIASLWNVLAKLQTNLEYIKITAPIRKN